MKLLRNLGTKIINGRKESRGEFLCLGCHKIVERMLSAGKRQKYCGCVTNKGINNQNYKHGDAGVAKLYRVWDGIIQRTKNINNKSYKNYGGRGITICPEWAESYIVFRDWALNNGYKENLEIDRKNTNGDYEPSNCHFVTSKENQRNRRNNVIKDIETANEIRTLYNSGYYTQREIGKKYNISQTMVSYIIKNKIWKS